MTHANPNTLDDLRIDMRGSVRPPPDMTAVARDALDDQHFAALMTLTGGAAPTPEQFLAHLENQRHDARNQRHDP